MSAEFRCEHCNYATGLFGESDGSEDDLVIYYDWRDEVDAHERACRERAEAEAEATAQREREAALADAAVVDYMAQATALLARADRAEGTLQPMLAATYRRAATTRMLRGRVVLRVRQRWAEAPAWCRQVSLGDPGAVVHSVLNDIRVDDFLEELGQGPLVARTAA